MNIQLICQKKNVEAMKYKAIFSTTVLRKDHYNTLYVTDSVVGLLLFILFII